MFSETNYFFLLHEVLLHFCLLPGNYFFFLLYFLSFFFFFLQQFTLLMDLLLLCFQWLLFSELTGKFPLVLREHSGTLEIFISLLIVTSTETISSVCSKINYSNLNTASTQTFHLLMVLGEKLLPEHSYIP